MEYRLLDRRDPLVAHVAELLAGGSDDLARATDIARDMITRFGMDEGLGYVAFEAQGSRFFDAPKLAPGGCQGAPHE